jgi:uncharacterized protein YecE (DUF72 family)
MVGASQPSLFSIPEDEASLAPVLRPRLNELAAHNILIGGSSWKYEGWLGNIYSPSRYRTRGRFSKKLFEETCLREYAETFPTVCGDFAFYQFPTDLFWQRLFAQVPETFQFVFKVPEQITCRTFPQIPRYGAQGGLTNHTFLDARLLQDAFLRLLEPYRQQTAALIFEFGHSGAPPRDFLELLAPFLTRLPRGFRYAVEIRNSEYLIPSYFSLLRDHNVAHVYNSWTRMPSLKEQIAIPNSRTADLLVTRALLRPGRLYEEAVRAFSPYAEIRDPNPEVRSALREILDISRAERRTSLLFVNNRLEGHAPGTIVHITDDA